MSFKAHTACRVCGNPDLVEYLDLGDHPLNNNLLSSPYDIPELYPLKLMLCPECGLSQLSVVVDPSVLFTKYVYRSSINKGYVDHCRQMAKDLKKRYSLTNYSYHIDIAGNDGALLKEFKDEIGLEVLNVDPAINLKDIAEASGILTISEFWTPKVALSVTSKLHKADLITATNVFAHVDGLHDFMEAVKIALSPTGVFIIEFPYIIDFLQNRQFDTIYFEHLSYFGIRPLRHLVRKFGMDVMRVDKFPIHGGTVRAHVGYKDADDTVARYLWMERNLTDADYADFTRGSKSAMNILKIGLETLKSRGNTITAFGASAKGTTLLNASGIDFKTIRYVLDETPEKQGKFCPKTLIEIQPLKWWMPMGTDYLLILAWNFKEEIIKKCRDLGYTGKFIIPIPEFKIID